MQILGTKNLKKEAKRHLKCTRAAVICLWTKYSLCKSDAVMYARKTKFILIFLNQNFLYQNFFENFTNFTNFSMFFENFLQNFA